jgi:signal transduction histidine kinase
VEAVGRRGRDRAQGAEPRAAIPADQLPTIFEPFRRVASGPEGLGLGLYIVKEIVRAHGGTIEVRSSADEGTTFACLWRRNGAAARPLAVPSPL